MSEDNLVNQSQKIISTKRSVDWLVKNTYVDTFNPLTMTGYQRDVDEAHCDRIVESLKRDFFLPTSIICSCRGEYSLTAKLFVVDGQHRIAALKKIQVNDPGRFLEIANFELPLIVMIKPTMEKEIDTFITINKTSKKVDTSLAYILRGIINQGKPSSDVTMSKRDYLAVQTAWVLSRDDAEDNLWKGKILFEGSTKSKPETITLNAFVLSTRRLISSLEKSLPLVFEWENEKQIESHVSFLKFFVLRLWTAIAEKWPDLFDQYEYKASVIQGAIGYSSINRFVCLLLDKWKRKSPSDSIFGTIERICAAIKDLPVDSSVWKTNSYYSKYSSEAGYSFIAGDLYRTLPPEYSYYLSEKSDQDLLFQSLREIAKDEDLLKEVRLLFSDDKQLQAINWSLNNALFLYRLSSCYSELYESLKSLDETNNQKSRDFSLMSSVSLPKIEQLFSSRNTAFDFRYLYKDAGTEAQLQANYCKVLSLILTRLFISYCKKKESSIVTTQQVNFSNSFSFHVTRKDNDDIRVALSL